MRCMGRRKLVALALGCVRGRGRRRGLVEAARAGGRPGDRARSARRRLRRLGSPAAAATPTTTRQLAPTFHRTMTTDATPATSAAISRARRSATAGVTRPDGPRRGGRLPDDVRARRAAPPRTVDRGARRRLAPLPAVPGRRGRQLWRLPVAYHVEEKRWFPMTGAFLFADPTPTIGRCRRRAAAAALRRRRLRSPRHALERQLRLLPQRRAQPGPRSARRARSTPASPSWAIACEACHGPGGEHARANADPLRRYTLHLARRAPIRPSSTRRACRRRAPPTCAAAATASASPTTSAPFLAHGDPFVPGDDLALLQRAALARHAAARRRDGVRGALLGRRHAAPDRLRVPGAAAVGCAQRGGLTCTSCHGMHDGDPRGQIRRASRRAAERRPRNDRCAPAVTRRWRRRRRASRTRTTIRRARGGRCVGCHMPRIVYGVLDVHRSHRIEVPTRRVPRRRPPRRVHPLSRRAACLGGAARGAGEAPR